MLGRRELLVKEVGKQASICVSRMDFSRAGSVANYQSLLKSIHMAVELTALQNQNQVLFTKMERLSLTSLSPTELTIAGHR